MDKDLTTAAASRLIGCTDSRVRQLLRSGELAGRRVGRDWLVDRAAAEAYRDRPATGGRGRPRTGTGR